jgi:hypothetical protein
MAKFIVKRLDEYLKVILEDFGSQNVNSSLFSGDVKLANARVRSDFLKEILQFPNIEIKEAILTHLQIHIPWTSIRKEPVSVDIDTLRVVRRALPPSYSRPTAYLCTIFQRNFPPLYLCNILPRSYSSPSI